MSTSVLGLSLCEVQTFQATIYRKDEDGNIEWTESGRHFISVPGVANLKEINRVCGIVLAARKDDEKTRSKGADIHTSFTAKLAHSRMLV